MLGMLYTRCVVLGILGNAAEVYMFGMLYMLYVIAAALGCLYGSVLFVPLLYPLRLTSAFQVSVLGS